MGSTPIDGKTEYHNDKLVFLAKSARPRAIWKQIITGDNGFFRNSKEMGSLRES